MTKSELKEKVEQTGSYYFTRETMRFFGDTMKNYHVPKHPVKVKRGYGDEVVECWELKRVHPVKHGLRDSAFFRCDNFDRIIAAKV